MFQGHFKNNWVTSNYVCVCVFCVKGLGRDRSTSIIFKAALNSI